jgi:hypothetical protein
VWVMAMVMVLRLYCTNVRILHHSDESFSPNLGCNLPLCSDAVSSSRSTTSREVFERRLGGAGCVSSTSSSSFVPASTLGTLPVEAFSSMVRGLMDLATETFRPVSDLTGPASTASSKVSYYAVGQQGLMP